MDWRKILKRLYGAGDSSHGNIGVLPEKGKRPSYPPKLQTNRVRYELRKHVNEDRKQAVSFRSHLRMNENIDNMFEDLKKEFSENIYQKLDLVIYDNDGNRYSKDDEFKEELFNKLFINYETNIVVIDRCGYSSFDIGTSILIEQEDLEVIGKVISIAVKHLSKIEFEEYTRG